MFVIQISILKTLIAALMLTWNFELAIFISIIILRLLLLFGSFNKIQLFGKHNVLVGGGGPTLDVLIPWHDASIVRYVNSTGWITLILLVFERLQVSHDLAEVEIACALLLLLARYVFLSFSLHIHLHHIEKVFISHGNGSFGQIIILPIDDLGVRTIVFVAYFVGVGRAIWVKELIVTYLIIVVCDLYSAWTTLTPLLHHLPCCL